MRGRSQASSRQSPSPPGRGDCKSRDPDLRRFLRLLWQASPRPLAARLEPEASLPGTSETIPVCELGGRRVRERDAVTVPKNSHHPGLRSNRLPLPPVQSQATPNPHWKKIPVRQTSSRPPYLFLPSGRSLGRKRKREPCLCLSSSSGQTGPREKKKPTASGSGKHQRC